MTAERVLACVAAMLGEARQRAAADGVRWSYRLESAWLLARGGLDGTGLAAGRGAVEPDRMLLSFEEAGARLGVSARTIKRLVHAGELSTVFVANCPRVRSSDLDEYVDKLPSRTGRPVADSPSAS